MKNTFRQRDTTSLFQGIYFYYLFDYLRGYYLYPPHEILEKKQEEINLCGELLFILHKVS